MLTNEEKDQLVAEITNRVKELMVDEVAERVLLQLPKVMGNLMMHQAAFTELNKKFYAEHPEFREYKPLVQSVVQEIDGKNPVMDYPDKLKLAIPEIKKRIALTKTVSHAPVEKKQLSLKFKKEDHGEI